jgi:hypothetical protein
VKIHPGLARHPPFQTDDIDIFCELSPVLKRHGQVFYVSGSYLLHSLSSNANWAAAATFSNILGL